MRASKDGPSFETLRKSAVPQDDGRVRGEMSSMHFITLDSETDFDGWRKAARALVLNGVKPPEVSWTVRGNEGASFGPPVDVSLEVPRGTFNVPAKFVELARAAILHRDPARFAL